MRPGVRYHFLTRAVRILACSLAILTQAYAVTYTFDGNPGPDWDDPNNWNPGGGPPAVGDCVFADGSALNSPEVPNISQDVSGLSFNNENLTITSFGTLRVRSISPGCGFTGDFNMSGTGILNMPSGTNSLYVARDFIFDGPQILGTAGSTIYLEDLDNSAGSATVDVNITVGSTLARLRINNLSRTINRFDLQNTDLTVAGGQASFSTAALGDRLMNNLIISGGNVDAGSGPDRLTITNTLTMNTGTGTMVGNARVIQVGNINLNAGSGSFFAGNSVIRMTSVFTNNSGNFNADSSTLECRGCNIGGSTATSFNIFHVPDGQAATFDMNGTVENLRMGTSGSGPVQMQIVNNRTLRVNDNIDFIAGSADIYIAGGAVFEFMATTADFSAPVLFDFLGGNPQLRVGSPSMTFDTVDFDFNNTNGVFNASSGGAIIFDNITLLQPDNATLNFNGATSFTNNSNFNLGNGTLDVRNTTYTNNADITVGGSGTIMHPSTMTIQTAHANITEYQINKDSIEVELSDRGLNINGLREQYTLRATSNTTGDTEDFIVCETGTRTGVFRNYITGGPCTPDTIPISNSGAVNANNGTLYHTNGTITITFVAGHDPRDTSDTTSAMITATDTTSWLAGTCTNSNFATNQCWSAGSPNAANNIDIDWSGASGNVTINTTGGHTVNNMTISDGSAHTVILSQSGIFDFNVNGNLFIDGHFQLVEASGSTTMSIDGDLTVNSGTGNSLNMGNGTTINMNGGAFNLDSPDGANTFSATSLIFLGGGNHANFNPHGHSLGDMNVVLNGGTLTMGSSFLVDDLTLNGFGAGSTWNCATHQLSVAVLSKPSPSNLDCSSGTLELVGNIAGVTSNANLNHLVVSSGNSTISASSTISGNLALNGGTLTTGNGDNLAVNNISFNGGTFSQGGNLTVNGSWAYTSGTYTHNNNNVIFPSDNTIDSSNQPFFNVFFNSGGSSHTLASDMTVANNLSITGALSTGTNKLTMEGSSFSVPGTLNVTGGTLETQRTMTLPPNVLLGNYIINGGVVTLPGDTTLDSLDIQLGSMVTGANTLTVMGSSLTTTGTLNVTNGTLRTQGTLTLPASNITHNNLVVNGGVLTISGDLAVNNLAVNTGAFLNNNAHTMTVNGNSLTTTGNLIFSGSSTLQIDGGPLTALNGNATIANLVVNGDLTTTAAAPTVTNLNVVGNMTLGANQTVATANISGVLDSNSNNFTVTGNTFTVSGNLTMTGATLETQGTLTLPTANITYGTLRVNGGALSLGGALNTGGNDIIVNSGSFNPSGFQVDAGQLQILGGGIVNGSTGLIQLSSRWDNSGTFNANSSTVRLTTNTNIQGSSATSFANLEITNGATVVTGFSAGVLTKTGANGLDANGQNIIIGNTLNLNSGSIDLPSGSTLDVTGATSTIAAGGTINLTSGELDLTGAEANFTNNGTINFSGGSRISRTPAFTITNPAGDITLGADTLQVQLLDPAQNLDGTSQESTTVRVTSATGDVETITLCETSASSGVFNSSTPACIGISTQATLASSTNFILEQSADGNITVDFTGASMPYSSGNITATRNAIIAPSNWLAATCPASNFSNAACWSAGVPSSIIPVSIDWTGATGDIAISIDATANTREITIPDAGTKRVFFAMSGNNWNTPAVSIQGQLSINNVGSATLAIAGDLTTTGTGAINLQSNALVELDGNLLLNSTDPNNSFDPASKINFNGTTQNITTNGIGLGEIELKGNTVVTLQDDLTLKGDLRLSTNSTFNVATHKLVLQAGFNKNGVSTFNGSSGTVETQSNITLPTSNVSINHLVVNGGTHSVSVAMNISGDLTVQSGNFTTDSTFQASNINLGGGTFSAGGTVTVRDSWLNTGGSFTPNNQLVVFNGSGTHSITSNGNAFEGIDISGSGTFNLLDNLSLVNYYQDSGIFNLNGHTLTNGSANFTVSAPGTFNGHPGTYAHINNFFNPTTSAQVTWGSLSASGGTIQTPTGLTLQGDMILNGGGLSVIGTLNIGGSFINNAGSGLIVSPHTLNFTSNSAATIEPTANMSNVTINAPGGTYTLKGNLSLANALTITDGTLTAIDSGVYRNISTGAILAINGGNLVLGDNAGGGTVNIGGNFNQSGGTLTAGLSTINLSADYIRNGGTFNSTGSTVNATTNCAIQTNGEPFYTLNVAGAGTVTTLTDPLTINNQLRFGSGTFNQSSNAITFNNDANSSTTTPLNLSTTPSSWTNRAALTFNFSKDNNGIVAAYNYGVDIFVNVDDGLRAGLGGAIMLASTNITAASLNPNPTVVPQFTTNNNNLNVGTITLGTANHPIHFAKGSSTVSNDDVIFNAAGSYATASSNPWNIRGNWSSISTSNNFDWGSSSLVFQNATIATIDNGTGNNADFPDTDFQASTGSTYRLAGNALNFRADANITVRPNALVDRATNNLAISFPPLNQITIEPLGAIDSAPTVTGAAVDGLTGTSVTTPIVQPIFTWAYNATDTIGGVPDTYTAWQLCIGTTQSDVNLFTGCNAFNSGKVLGTDTSRQVSGLMAGTQYYWNIRVYDQSNMASAGFGTARGITVAEAALTINTTSAHTPAAQDVLPNSTGMNLLHFTIQETGDLNDPVDLQSISFNNAGTGSLANVNQVSIIEDVSIIGTYEPGVDTTTYTGVISGNTVSFDTTTPATSITNGGTRNYWLRVDLNNPGTANYNETFQFQVAGALGDQNGPLVGMNATSNAQSNPIRIKYGSAQVSDLTGNYPNADNTIGDGVRKAVLKFTISEISGIEPITIDTITITNVGTANESQDLANPVELLDASQAQLVTANRPGADDGNITFNLTALAAGDKTIAAGGSKDFYVTYEVTVSNNTVGATYLQGNITATDLGIINGSAAHGKTAFLTGSRDGRQLVISKPEIRVSHTDIPATERLLITGAPDASRVLYELNVEEISNTFQATVKSIGFSAANTTGAGWGSVANSNLTDIQLTAGGNEIKLHIDSNSNGQFEPGIDQEAFGAASGFDITAGGFLFNGVDVTIPPGQTRKFFLVANVEADTSIFYESGITDPNLKNFKINFDYASIDADTTDPATSDTTIAFDPGFNATGSTFTFEQGLMTISEIVDGSLNKFPAPGVKDTEIMKFQIQNTTPGSSAVLLTGFGVDVTPNDTSIIEGVTLKNSAGTVLSNFSGFSGTLSVPQEFVAKSATREYIISIDLTAIAPSGTPITVNVTPQGGFASVPGAGITATGINVSRDLETTLEVRNNYPNFKNGEFALILFKKSSSSTKVQIFSLSGEVVRDYGDVQTPNTVNQIRWYGETDRGDQAGFGVYFVQIQQGQTRLFKKVFVRKGAK